MAKSVSINNRQRTRQQRSSSRVGIGKVSKTKSQTRTQQQVKTTSRNRPQRRQPSQVADAGRKRRKELTKEQSSKKTSNVNIQNSIIDDSSCILAAALDGEQPVVEKEEQCTEHVDQADAADDIPEYFKTEFNKIDCNKENQVVRIPENFQAQVLSLEEEFAEERRKLRDKYSSQFERWFEILQEFNILCYGNGSKRNVLNEFAEHCKQRSSTVVVHGYHTLFSLKELLVKIEKEILQLPIEISNRRTPAEQVRSIEKHLAKDSFPSSIFVIVHSIDGPKMQSSEIQEILSHIACIPKINLVASIDHFNAAMLWNRNVYQRLNWYWEQVVTEDSYLYEISDTSFLTNGEGDESRVKAAVLLFSTLTKNAHQIFLELAALLEKSKESKLSHTKRMAKARGVETGVGLHSFYEHCRKKFLVSNPNSLKSILKELKDHELISITSSSTSAETIQIELKPKQLEAVISILQGEGAKNR
ncbi:Origin of replication complex subunit 2 [Galdieria sulphuraria]|nr:Origin of replication complex subunit 2 [Galdieria sulphuraria]